MVINSTKVIVSPQEITVREGPLSWLGNQKLKRDDVAELYIGSNSRFENRVSVRKFDWQVSASWRRGWYRKIPIRGDIELYGRMNNGNHVRFLRGLPSVQYSRFIQHKVEAYWQDNQEFVRERLL